MASSGSGGSGGKNDDEIIIDVSTNVDKALEGFKKIGKEAKITANRVKLEMEDIFRKVNFTGKFNTQDAKLFVDQVHKMTEAFNKLALSGKKAPKDIQAALSEVQRHIKRAMKDIDFAPGRKGDFTQAIGDVLRQQSRIIGSHGDLKQVKENFDRYKDLQKSSLAALKKAAEDNSTSLAEIAKKKNDKILQDQQAASAKLLAQKAAEAAKAKAIEDKKQAKAEADLQREKDREAKKLKREAERKQAKVDKVKMNIDLSLAARKIDTNELRRQIHQELKRTTAGTQFKNLVNVLAFGQITETLRETSQGMIQAAAKFEQYRKTLEVVVKDPARTRELEAFLLEYEKKTAYNLPEIMKLGIQMSTKETAEALSKAGFSAEQAIRMAGEFGAKNPDGGGIEVAGGALLKILAGDPNGLEILRNQFGLSSSVLEKRGIYRGSSGYSLGTMEERVNVLRALKDYQETTTGGNLAEEQSRTLGGLLSTLGSQLFKTMATTVEPLVPLIKEVVKGLISFLEWIERIPASARALIASFVFMSTAVSTIGQAMASVRLLTQAIGNAFRGNRGPGDLEEAVFRVLGRNQIRGTTKTALARQFLAEFAAEAATTTTATAVAKGGASSLVAQGLGSAGGAAGGQILSNMTALKGQHFIPKGSGLPLGAPGPNPLIGQLGGMGAQTLVTAGAVATTQAATQAVTKVGLLGKVTAALSAAFGFLAAKVTAVTGSLATFASWLLKTPMRAAGTAGALAAGLYTLGSAVYEKEVGEPARIQTSRRRQRYGPPSMVPRHTPWGGTRYDEIEQGPDGKLSAWDALNQASKNARLDSGRFKEDAEWSLWRTSSREQQQAVLDRLTKSLEISRADTKLALTERGIDSIDFQLAQAASNRLQRIVDEMANWLKTGGLTINKMQATVDLLPVIREAGMGLGGNLLGEGTELQMLERIRDSRLADFNKEMQKFIDKGYTQEQALIETSGTELGRSLGQAISAVLSQKAKDKAITRAIIQQGMDLSMADLAGREGTDQANVDDRLANMRDRLNDMATLTSTFDLNTEDGKQQKRQLDLAIKQLQNEISATELNKVKAARSAATEIIGISKDEYRAKIRLLNDEMIEFKKMVTDKTLQQQYYAAKMLEIEREHQIQISQLRRNNQAIRDSMVMPAVDQRLSSNEQLQSQLQANLQKFSIDTQVQGLKALETAQKAQIKLLEEQARKTKELNQAETERTIGGLRDQLRFPIREDKKAEILDNIKAEQEALKERNRLIDVGLSMRKSEIDQANTLAKIELLRAQSQQRYASTGTAFDLERKRLEMLAESEGLSKANDFRTIENLKQRYDLEKASMEMAVQNKLNDPTMSEADKQNLIKQHQLEIIGLQQKYLENAKASNSTLQEHIDKLKELKALYYNEDGTTMGETFGVDQLSEKLRIDSEYFRLKAGFGKGGGAGFSDDDQRNARLLGFDPFANREKLRQGTSMGGQIGAATMEELKARIGEEAALKLVEKLKNTNPQDMIGNAEKVLEGYKRGDFTMTSPFMPSGNPAELLKDMRIQNEININLLEGGKTVQKETRIFEDNYDPRNKNVPRGGKGV